MLRKSSATSDTVGTAMNVRRWIMGRRVSTLTIFSFLVLVSTSLWAQKAYSASEAKEHVGESAAVCGTVESTHWARSSRGSPTFINLDKAYPNQIFTVLIWGSDRPKFGDPERDYKGKHICIRGDIRDYKGVPEIVA